MTILHALLVTLLVASADPAAVFRAHVAAAVERLCPCPAADAACAQHHARAARAVAVVALDEDDPDEAAVRLIGLGCHESRMAVEHQIRGGEAVTYWQLEVPAASRAPLLADPVLAARRALAVRKRGLAAYACGGTCPAKAAELGRSEAVARWAWGR